MKVAFVHGFAGDRSSWDTIDLEGVRVAVPGHEAPAVATWDAALAAIAAQAGSAEVVVGYSLGARLALGLVATGRAPAAVLIGVNPGIGDPIERDARRASDAAWASLLRTRGIDAFVDAWEAQPMWESQARRVPRHVLAARRARRCALDPLGLASALESMGLGAMPDYRAAVRAHAARLALVVGSEDAKFVAIARALVADSPALPLDLIPESGHDPVLEQPEGLSRAVERALAHVTSATS